LSSLDPRSPYVLDTHELGRRPGSMRKLQRTVPAPEDLGTEVIGVPAGSDLELDLRLESVMEGVLVSGTARGLATGEWWRCLDDVVREVDGDFQELYNYPDSRSSTHHGHRGKAAEAEEDDEDTYELEGELLDLEPVIRDAVVLALPFQPVCSEDCPGLCSQCGARLADDPEHHHEDVDPRWAALQNLVSPDRDQQEEK
jgi:uncharacterized protein